jgi:hypothetical protein
MVLELIGELLGLFSYGLGYIFLRLVGVRRPSERACIVESTVVYGITLICLVYILSRA